MKTELESHEIRAIVKEILPELADALRPHLSVNGNDGDGDLIFDVPGLCEYLHVTEKWIYERTHLKEIPYYKLSNKVLRFRKKDIDKWIESRKTPAVNDFRGRLKAVG